MKRRGTAIGSPVAIWCAVWLVTAVAPAPLDGAEVERLVRDFRVGEYEVIRVEAPVAALSLEPYPGREIQAELVVSCAGDFYPCREQAKKIRLVSEPAEGKLAVKLVGPFNHLAGGHDLRMVYHAGFRSCRLGGRPPSVQFLNRGKSKSSYRLSADLTVRYPMGRALEIGLGHGHLLLSGPDRPVSAEVGEGTVSIFVSGERVGSVELRTARGGRAGLFLADGRVADSGRRVRWTEGTGPVDLAVSVGKGDAAVRLVP